jgi:hypothetical protein
MKLHLHAEKVTEKELQEAYEIARIVFEGKKCRLVFHDYSGNIIYQETLTEQMLKRKEVEKK